jgi:hypothetical protein
VELHAGLARDAGILGADAAQGDDRLVPLLSDVQARHVERETVDIGDVRAIERFQVEGADCLGLVLHVRRVEALAGHGDGLDALWLRLGWCGLGRRTRIGHLLRSRGTAEQQREG